MQVKPVTSIESAFYRVPAFYRVTGRATIGRFGASGKLRKTGQKRARQLLTCL